MPLAALLALALAADPSPAGAGCQGPLGRAEVVACALAEHPRLRVAEETREAARGRRLGARALLPSDPQVEVTAARRDGLRSGERDVNVYGRISQELEVAGQRRRRLAVADAEIEAAERAVAAIRRELAAAALTAYYEVIAAQEERAMIDRIAASSTKLVELARTSEAAGLTSGLGADVAIAASVRVRRAQLDAGRRLNAARTRLAGLLGRDPSATPPAVAGDLSPLALPDDLDRLVATALARRAELDRLEAERQAALRRIELYRRLRAPNPALVLFAQRDGFGERVVGGGLAIPITLPAPLGRAYAGEIAESRALARRAAAEIERLRREVRGEVALAHGELAARRREQALFEDDRLRRAEDHLVALGEEMAAGRLSIREAVVLQQTLLEYLAGAIEARRALALASVELARAAGLLPEEATP